MEMEQEKRRLFPKEYAHVEGWVLDAQREILRMEKEIQKLAGENWSQPAPAPKGPPPIDREQYRQRIIADYKRQIEQKGKDTIEKIKPELANTEPRLAVKIMEKTGHLLDKDNRFKGADKEDLRRDQNVVKEPEVSFEYVSAKYFNSSTYFNEKPGGGSGSTYTDRSNFSRAENAAGKTDGTNTPAPAPEGPDPMDD